MYSLQDKNREATKQAMYHNARTRHVNVKHCCRGKAIGITHSEYVFEASGIQHSMRMRQIVICGLSGCTIFFPHYLINGTIFEIKFIEHKMCLDFLYNFSLKNSHSKKKGARYDKNVYWSSCKVSVILVRF